MVDESLAINQLINNILEEEESKVSVLEQQKTFLSELENCHKQIDQDRERIVLDWDNHLDFAANFQKYHAEFSEIYTERYNFNPMHDGKFLAKAQTIEAETKTLKDECLDTIDTAKKRYTRYLKELGLEVRRMDYQNINHQDIFLPNVQKKRLADEIDTKKHQATDITDEYVDKTKYIKDLRDR